jgi:hypothetical protein
MSKWLGGKRYEFAMQWENVDDGVGGTPPQWRYWDGAVWVALSPAITQCLTGDLTNSATNWHQFRLEGAIVNNQAEYRSFTIDQNEHLLAVAPITPKTETQPDQLAVAIQLDSNSTSAPYEMLVDKVSFVRWPGLLAGLSPMNNSVLNTLRPTLSWGALSGAVRYQVQLALSNDPGPIVYDGVGRTYTSACPLKTGDWYWRVRGVDAAGHQSPWTKPQKMTLQIPSGDVPSLNYYVTPTPSISWNRVKDAVAYQVQLNTDLIEVSGPTLEITRTLANGPYCWRVRAKYSNGLWGPWSTPDSFIVDAP